MPVAVAIGISITVAVAVVAVDRDADDRRVRDRGDSLNTQVQGLVFVFLRIPYVSAGGREEAVCKSNEMRFHCYDS